jgi:hypothetical protein
MVEVLELVRIVVVGMLVVKRMDELDEVLAGLDVLERVGELDDEVDVEIVEELEGGRLDVEEVVELDDELGRLEVEDDEGALVEIELLDEELDEEEEVLRTELLELETDTAVKLYIVSRDEPPHCFNY